MLSDDEEENEIEEDDYNSDGSIIHNIDDSDSGDEFIEDDPSRLRRIQQTLDSAKRDTEIPVKHFNNSNIDDIDESKLSFRSNYREPIRCYIKTSIRKQSILRLQRYLAKKRSIN